MKNFLCDGVDIFLHYNKNFRLPKCKRMLKKCTCFRYDSKYDFYSGCPRQYVFYLKKFIRKILREIEKHNNHNVICLSKCANTTKRITVRNALKEHIKTLKIFKICYEKMSKKKKFFLRYIIYIDHQVKRCENLLEDIRPWELDDQVPLFELTSIYFSHYHTLNIFEKFVK